jgi:hypothetical protein
MSTKLRVIQSHQNGDLFIRFALEADSRDVELMTKFGEPEIEVGGTFFQDATLGAPTIAGGAITVVPVATPGANFTYSAQKAITFGTTGTSGSGATFVAVLNGNGQLASVTVSAGGTGYSNDTLVRILSGSHVTTYPSQKVKLLSGFPYTRRINTIAPGDTSLSALATLYVNQIESNVAAALTALRALDTTTTDLTRETVYQP